MEKSGRMPWGCYLLLHGAVLLAALGFLLFAWLAERFLPEQYLHCFLHDLLRLYCPLCGGTRAARAVLTFDLRRAFLLAPTVFLTLAAGAVLDVIALIRLCRKRGGALLPKGALALVGGGLLLATCVRNALMLFGIDPTGELGAFWAPRLPTEVKVVSAITLLFLGIELFIACYDGRKKLPARFRGTVLIAASVLGMALTALLWAVIL